MVDENRTLWCGNLSDKVTEELLYELFLQAAPLERVRIPTDKEGRKSNFAFITVKHEASVDYVVQLLNGTSLYDRRINLKPRNRPQQASESQQQNVVNDQFNQLFFMGQMMQLAYNNCLQPNYNNRQNNGDKFNSPREENKPYSKHHNNRHDKNGSGWQGRNQWNNHRNHNDRSRRRYY